MKTKYEVNSTMSSCIQYVPCVAFGVHGNLQVESLVLVQLLAKLLAGILVLLLVGQGCP